MEATLSTDLETIEWKIEWTTLSLKMVRYRRPDYPHEMPGVAKKLQVSALRVRCGMFVAELFCMKGVYQRKSTTRRQNDQATIFG